MGSSFRKEGARDRRGPRAPGWSRAVKRRGTSAVDHPAEGAHGGGAHRRGRTRAISVVRAVEEDGAAEDPRPRVGPGSALDRERERIWGGMRREHAARLFLGGEGLERGKALLERSS